MAKKKFKIDHFLFFCPILFHDFTSTLTSKMHSTPCHKTVPWQVMRMFKIPDVDLLEHKYEGTNVRLAPHDQESATITFNTGVAQDSITSLQLFNIFINALLRMLTITGQNEDISYGLQIGKDEKGNNQRDENGYQLNKIGFIDDISIFADTPERMQKLLNVVQEFAAWCGMQINVKKCVC